ncbi:penicillin-insensitive murein endopeptidase [Pseudoduganella flava]|uniref:penicillin-insensitive murein endopeptidase n=1 Tax=Pseudoduganella flava TaxID=871742 RepID=UPI0013039C85|nr:penicillin-insensitive murein endopeptidase [Pseudoduganella flava]
MLRIQPKDGRGYFVLPQAPEQAGYYVYGTPSGGQGQYAHPTLLSILFLVEREWEARDTRKFGVGNISLANGIPYPGHGTHKSGLEVDIRPLRKDGANCAVTRFMAEYDRDGTEKLIGLFMSLSAVELIYFNDLAIPHVRRASNHDDHFHVKLWVPKS